MTSHGDIHEYRRWPFAPMSFRVYAFRPLPTRFLLSSPARLASARLWHVRLSIVMQGKSVRTRPSAKASFHVTCGFLSFATLHQFRSSFSPPSHEMRCMSVRHFIRQLAHLRLSSAIRHDGFQLDCRSSIFDGARCAYRPLYIRISAGRHRFDTMAD